MQNAKPARRPGRPRKSESSPTPAPDLVNPSHYKQGGFETADVLTAWVSAAPDPVAGALQWNCLKYLARMWRKDNPQVDLQKSLWYAERLRQHLEKEALAASSSS